MSFHSEILAERIWLTAQDRLPNVCCDCGMYTDHRVRVSHVQLIQQPGAAPAGCGVILITLLIHVALGPLGWLISLLVHSGDEAKLAKTVKVKTKLKISQCLLCAGMGRPIVIDVRSQQQQMLFAVHPQFKRRLDEETQKHLANKQI